MKRLSKKEFDTITLSELKNEKIFRELHSFALTDKGREVLTAGNNYVKIKNHVGVIQTKSGFVLEILPKIYNAESDIEQTRQMFIRMLKSLRKVPKYKKLKFTNLSTNRIPILEVFIGMFIDEVLTIISKGIKSDYVSFEENLNYMKGKIVAGEHMRRNIVQRQRFFVNYDKYIEDIPKNRILKAALLFCRKCSHLNDNHKRIQELLFIFDDVSIPLFPEHEYNRITSDRTSDYYARALEWAMIFLGEKSFTAYSGSSIAYALLFPMEIVFESFVFNCLKKHSSITNLIYQTSKYYLASENFEPIFKIKPDIIATNEDGSKRFIIDAKWKLLDQGKREEKYGISQSDMYQLLSYAEIYRANENRDIELFLIYPKTELLNRNIQFTFNDISKTVINVIPFDIQAILQGDYGCFDWEE